MKKYNKNSISRNPFALHAKKRKSGKIRSENDKRKSGKNKQREFLKEI